MERMPGRLHWKDGVKRAFDIVVSLAALILLAPFMALIALTIRRGSPGPALYRGRRIGRGGVAFDILKFRTMYEAPESYQGPRVTASDDPRVTHFGRWLRATKLNELPQFWNVLKGEMSLVGPRPEDPSIAKTWSHDVWREVLSVRPGITSPASVLYRNEEQLLHQQDVLKEYLEDLAPDKIRLDQLYVRNRSFWLDLDILLWTAIILLPRIRSYNPPEALLFVGPVTRLVRRHVRWFLVDLLTTFAAIGLMGLLWRAYGPLNVGWPRAIGIGLGFALLFSLVDAALGVNRIHWALAVDRDVVDLLPAWTIASLLTIAANFLLRAFPAGMICLACGLSLAGYIAARYRTRLITGFLGRVMRLRSKARTVCERVLIAGTGANAQLTAWVLCHPAIFQKFWVTGFVANDLGQQGLRIYGARVLGQYADIRRLVEAYDIGIVFVTDAALPAQQVEAIAADCRAASARLVVVPEMLKAFGSLIEPVPGDAAGGATALPVPAGATPLCAYCLARNGYAPVGAEDDGRDWLAQ